MKLKWYSTLSNFRPAKILRELTVQGSRYNSSMIEWVCRARCLLSDCLVSRESKYTFRPRNDSQYILLAHLLWRGMPSPLRCTDPAAICAIVVNQDYIESIYSGLSKLAEGSTTEMRRARRKTRTNDSLASDLVSKAAPDQSIFPRYFISALKSWSRLSSLPDRSRLAVSM